MAALSTVMLLIVVRVQSPVTPLTDTLKVQELVRPASSLAVQVTRCGEPATVKLDPDGWSQVTLTLPLLSVAVGVA